MKLHHKLKTKTNVKVRRALSQTPRRLGAFNRRDRRKKTQSARRIEDENFTLRFFVNFAVKSSCFDDLRKKAPLLLLQRSLLYDQLESARCRRGARGSAAHGNGVVPLRGSSRSDPVGVAAAGCQPQRGESQHDNQSQEAHAAQRAPSRSGCKDKTQQSRQQRRIDDTTAVIEMLKRSHSWRDGCDVGGDRPRSVD